MSLLKEAYEEFTIINKAIVPDGYGGTETVYTDGAKIQGALVLDTAGETRIAQALGATANYTLTVEKQIELDYHTIIRREKDGAYFRLTNDSDDKKTPASATLNMRQYSAERWQLA